jgi:hypothetical protein
MSDVTNSHDFIDKKICNRHFELDFMDENKTTLKQNAIPTLCLNKGNTLFDFEELLAEKPSPASEMKKKRGTRGTKSILFNLTSFKFYNIFCRSPKFRKRSPKEI